MATHFVSNLLDRLASLKSARTHWESTWQETVDFTMPGRSPVTGTVNPGRRNDSKIYDGSPGQGLERLASVLYSMATNPDTNWFELETEDTQANAQQEVKQYLEECQQVIKRGFDNSNFYTQVMEFFSDWPGFGTASMFIGESKKNGRDLYFLCHPVREVFLLLDDEGEVQAVFRLRSMTARQIVDKWGKAKAGPKVAKELDKNPDEDREILHAVMPRNHYQGGRRAREKEFASVWIDVEAERKIHESGFDELPYAVARWRVDSGEVYGRGPVIMTMPDIKTLNTMNKDLLDAGELALRPPLNVSDENEEPDISSAAINFYKSGTTDRVEPIELGRGMPIGMEMIQGKRDAVSDGLYVSQLQLIDAKEMTAEEVRTRTLQNLRILGPVFTRLQNEFFRPLITRVYAILGRKGKLPKPPASIEGKNLRIKYISPIAKAQKAHEVQAITHTVGTAMNWAKARPDVMDNIDLDKALDYVSDLDGTPAAVMVDQEKVDQIRKKRAELQKQQRQLEMAKLASEGGRNVAQGRAALESAGQGGGPDAG